MTCKISRPTPQALFKRVQDMFSSTVLGGAPIIPESNEWYVTSNDYAMAEEFYSFSEQQWRERDPRYACCENLNDIASFDGVYPRPSTFAQGYVNVTGDPGAPLQQDLEFQFGNHLYAPISTVPVAMPGGGKITLRVSAIEPGPEGNIPSTSPEGTLTTPLPGISNVVTVCGGQFCGGAVAETCEQFRSRYLDRIKYKPNLGLDLVKQEVLNWPCVTSVCERGGLCCNDVDECSRDIHLYAIFDDTFPCGMAPANIVDEMTAEFFGEPQGIGAGILPMGFRGRIHTATPGYVDVVIDGLYCISPSQANAIRERITDFISRNCPSHPLLVQDLKVIISQITGTTTNYDVIMSTDDPNISINTCGDAEPMCDVRICLNDIIFSNPAGAIQGAC